MFVSVSRCSATSPLLFITGSILLRLFLAQTWKVQWCYLCLVLPLFFFLSFNPPPHSSLTLSISPLLFSSPGSLHQLVLLILTSCALPLIGKWWWDSKTIADTMHSGKGGNDLDKGCREGETTGEWDPSVFFLHFYHIYVHPQRVLCLCLGHCLHLCALLFVVVIIWSIPPLTLPLPPPTLSY